MRRVAIFLFCILMVSMFVSACGPKPTKPKFTADEILDRLLTEAKQEQSRQMDMLAIVDNLGTKIKLTVYSKKPDKLRIEDKIGQTRGLSDNRYWIWFPDDNAYIEASLEELDLGPEYVQGLNLIEKLLNNLEKKAVEQRGNVVLLELTSKDPSVLDQSMLKLWVDTKEWVLTKMAVLDQKGETIYQAEFYNIKRNIELDDSLFNPPPEAEKIDDPASVYLSLYSEFMSLGLKKFAKQAAEMAVKYPMDDLEFKAILYAFIGSEERLKGNTDKALEALNQALEGPLPDEVRFSAAYQAATILLENEDYNYLAIPYLEEALKYAPDDSDTKRNILKNLGWCYLGWNDQKSAFYFGEALKYTPEDHPEYEAIKNTFDFVKFAQENGLKEKLGNALKEIQTKD